MTDAPNPVAWEMYLILLLVLVVASWTVGGVLLLGRGGVQYPTRVTIEDQVPTMFEGET